MVIAKDMIFDLFRKKSDSTASEVRIMKHNIEASFSKLREEMDKISSWIHHFNEKHHEHDDDKENLHKRLQSIEKFIEQLKIYNILSKQNIKQEQILEKPQLDISPWDSLSQSQKNICYILAALNSENPDSWISLKQLAQEIYPSKKYESVRSTMSEFTTILEELGYLKKKRIGKQTYVISTDKNPYLNEKKVEVKKIKSKISKKEGKK